jgi:hypothetical protein
MHSKSRSIALRDFFLHQVQEAMSNGIGDYRDLHVYPFHDFMSKNTQLRQVSLTVAQVCVKKFRSGRMIISHASYGD